MKHAFGRTRPRLDLAAAILLTASVAGCGGFRIVGGGGAWRSPQPTVADLEFAASSLGVRTVICLRGASPGKSWFEEETAACRRLGLQFVVLGWSARGVDEQKVSRLLQVFEQHPGPYLIHCRAGKDRSSLASAIYRAVVLGHDFESAADEIALFPHGHVPMFGYEAIDEAWERFCVGYTRTDRVIAPESRSASDRSDRSSARGAR